jgi:hypothetical protein
MWGTIIAAGIGLLSANKANKAAQAQTDAMLETARMEDRRIRELTAPWLQQAKFAMPMLRQTIMSQLAPEVGRDDPFLTKERDIAMRDIGRGEQTALGQTARRWTATGNIGRGRGEQLRIGRSAEEARGEVGLQYGKAQRSYRQGASAAFINALSGLANQGTQGLGPAVTGARDLAQGTMEAARTRAEGQTGMWGDIAGIGASVGQYFDERKLQKQLDELLKKQKKTTGGS